MSTCISKHGEFGSHTLDDAYTCTLCHVLDEDALIAELRQRRDEVEKLKGARLLSVIFGHHGPAPKPFALHEPGEWKPAHFLGAQWPDGYVVVRPGPTGGVMPWRSVEAMLADFAASDLRFEVVWLSDELPSLAEMEQQLEQAQAAVAAAREEGRKQGLAEAAAAIRAADTSRWPGGRQSEVDGCQEAAARAVEALEAQTKRVEVT